jgi:hypothetical protein
MARNNHSFFCYPKLFKIKSHYPTSRKTDLLLVGSKLLFCLLKYRVEKKSQR